MEAREYELMRSVEDRMWWYRAVHANVLTLLGRHMPGHEAILLDAGCGTGGLLRRLAAERPAWFLFGLDAAPNALSRAVRGPRARMVAGDVNHIPFSDASFDAIVSVDVLSHRAVEVEDTLAEFRRCLTPGGVLLLNLPAYGWMKSGHDERVHNVRRFNRPDAVAMVERAGFRVIRATYWNTLLFPLMVLRRLLSRGSEAESDVREYPPLLDRLFGALTAVERRAVEAGINLPFGGSLLVVAVKQHA
jgi:SAM-dependent methyltransferase